MYKNILVPVDGSSTSLNALREAVKLATEQKATLRLVHFVNELPYPVSGEMYVDLDLLQRASREAGQAVLDKAVQIAREAGLPAETQLFDSHGMHPAQLILEAARDWPADIIVIGTHGRRGLEHLLLGSVAEGVLRGATTPVLLLRG